MDALRTDKRLKRIRREAKHYKINLLPPEFYTTIQTRDFNWLMEKVEELSEREGRKGCDGKE